MKNLLNQTNKTFSIVCLKCNRKSCAYVFTDDGDIVITCNACSSTELVRRK